MNRKRGPSIAALPPNNGNGRTCGNVSIPFSSLSSSNPFAGTRIFEACFGDRLPDKLVFSRTPQWGKTRAVSRVCDKNKAERRAIRMTIVADHNY
jgi:hypothetical protein